jgi:predicted amidohydrolase
MKIALIQQMAPEAAGYASTRQKIYALLREAAAKGAQLAVLPEMAFPSYFISQSDALREEALSQTRALLDDVAAIARELRLHIAVGDCAQAAGGPSHSAEFYDAEGTRLHTSRKSNMWHLDSLQFTPGQEYRAFDTKLGRIGLMICADGRVPEICRILALDGAALILDPVNLLGTASDPKDLANQQSAYILPVRALENRVWLVVANKVGLEAKCLRYLGRSMLIGPDGQIAVQASTDKEEVVVCEFDPSQDRGAPEAREPRLYKELTRPKAQTAAHELLSKALPGPDTLEVYTCTAQFSAGSHEAYLEKAAFHLNMCKWLMAGLVLFPAMKDDCDLLGTAKALMENMP